MDLSPGGQSVDKKPVISPDGLIQSHDSPSAETSNTTVTPQPITSIDATVGTGHLTVDQLDIDILPVIYDIIRCVEKDPVENNSKQRESQECSHKLIELQKRLDSAREQIKQLRGIDYNKEEQQQRLELLRNQLKSKQELIQKFLLRYLANNEQLIQRMSESYPMRRAAQIVVSIMYRTKNIAQQQGLHEMSPERFKSFINLFKNNIKQEIEGVKQEIKKKKN